MLSMELSELENKSKNQIKKFIEPKEREAKSGLFDVKTTSLIGLTIWPSAGRAIIVLERRAWHRG